MNYLLAILSFFLVPVAQATLLSNIDFEDGDYSEMYCSGNCPTVISTDARTGSKSLKFVLDYNSSPERKRTMAIIHSAQGGWFNIGDEIWVGFATKLIDWDSDTSGEIIFQIHDSYEEHWECDTTENRSFPVMMGADSGKYYISANPHKSPNEVWETENYTTGQWVDWVYHIKIKTDSTGQVEAWKNGTKVIDYSGPTYYNPGGYCNKDGAYTGFGIYKWDWDWEWGGPTQSDYREILIDNIKVGNSSSNYTEVFPGGGGSDTEAPSVPGGVSVSVVSSTAQDVSWSASTDNVAVDYYEVWRDSTKVQETSSLTYAAIGLTPATSYSWTIKAVDTSANTSAASTAVVKWTPATPHLAINDDIQVNVDSTNVKSCPWPCSTLGTQNSGATGKVIGGPNWSYDSNGSYNWYNIDFTTGQDGWVYWQWLDKVTDTEDPSVPGNLDVWVLSATSQRLTWTASTDNVGVTGYKIYKDGNYLTTVATTTYDAVSLTMGTQYAWKVTAIDAASNESGFSTVVNETSCDIR